MKTVDHRAVCGEYYDLIHKLGYILSGFVMLYIIYYLIYKYLLNKIKIILIKYTFLSRVFFHILSVFNTEHRVEVIYISMTVTLAVEK